MLVGEFSHPVYPGWKGKLWLLYRMNFLYGQASTRQTEQLKLDTATSAESKASCRDKVSNEHDRASEGRNACL